MLIRIKKHCTVLKIKRKLNSVRVRVRESKSTVIKWAKRSWKKSSTDLSAYQLLTAKLINATIPYSAAVSETTLDTLHIHTYNDYVVGKMMIIMGQWIGKMRMNPQFHSNELVGDVIYQAKRDKIVHRMIFDGERPERH